MGILGAYAIVGIMNTEYKNAYNFLLGHKFAVLSTTSKNAKPWGSTIYYVVDEKLNFFFLTHVESTKYHNLKEQPQAAITVPDDIEQSTVQAVGAVTEVPLGPERDHAFRMIVQVHPPGQFEWIPPVTKMDAGEVLLLKLTPEVLRFSDFSPKDGARITEVISVAAHAGQ